MAVSGVGPVREECDWNNASPSLFSLYSRTASAPTLLSLLNRRQFRQFSMSLLGNTIRPAASTALGDKFWVLLLSSFLAFPTISVWFPHTPSFFPSFKYALVYFNSYLEFHLPNTSLRMSVLQIPFLTRASILPQVGICYIPILWYIQRKHAVFQGRWRTIKNCVSVDYSASRPSIICHFLSVTLH